MGRGGNRYDYRTIVSLSPFFRVIFRGNNKIVYFISDSPSDGYSKDCRM